MTKFMLIGGNLQAGNSLMPLWATTVLNTKTSQFYELRKSPRIEFLGLGLKLVEVML